MCTCKSLCLIAWNVARRPCQGNIIKYFSYFYLQCLVLLKSVLNSWYSHGANNLQQSNAFPLSELIFTKLIDISWAISPWRWHHYAVSKRRAPITQWHRAIPQKKVGFKLWIVWKDNINGRCKLQSQPKTLLQAYSQHKSSHGTPVLMSLTRIWNVHRSYPGSIDRLWLIH